MASVSNKVRAKQKEKETALTEEDGNASKQFANGKNKEISKVILIFFFSYIINVDLHIDFLKFL